MRNPQSRQPKSAELSTSRDHRSRDAAGIRPARHVLPAITMRLLLLSTLLVTTSCLPLPANSWVESAPAEPAYSEPVAAAEPAYDPPAAEPIAEPAVGVAAAEPIVAPSPEPAFHLASHDQAAHARRGGGRRSRGPHGGRGGGWSGTPLDAAGDACANLVYTSDARDRCVRSLISARYDARGVTSACANIVYTSEARLQCVASAVTAYADPSTGIAACANIVYTSEARLQCVASAAAGLLEPRTVSACADLVYTSDARLTCVRELAGARRDPVEVITYCKDAHYTSDSRLACLRTFR